MDDVVLVLDSAHPLIEIGTGSQPTAAREAVVQQHDLAQKRRFAVRAKCRGRGQVQLSEARVLRRQFPIRIRADDLPYPSSEQALVAMARKLLDEAVRSHASRVTIERVIREVS